MSNLSKFREEYLKLKWNFKVTEPLGIIYTHPNDPDGYAYACGKGDTEHGGMTSYDSGLASCVGCIEALTVEARAIHDKAQEKLME